MSVPINIPTIPMGGLVDDLFQANPDLTVNASLPSILSDALPKLWNVLHWRFMTGPNTQIAYILSCNY